MTIHSDITSLAYRLRDAGVKGEAAILLSSRQDALTMQEKILLDLPAYIKRERPLSMLTEIGGVAFEYFLVGGVKIMWPRP